MARPSYVSGGVATQNSTTSLTLSLNARQAGNRVLIVAVRIATNTVSPTSVKYAGVDLTFISRRDPVDITGRMEIWGLINPASGTNDLVATYAAAQNIRMGAAVFCNADQTTGWRGSGASAEGNTGPQAVDITCGPSDNCVGIVFHAAAGSLTNPGSDQVLIADNASNIMAARKEGVGSSCNISWNSAGVNWVMAGVAVLPGTADVVTLSPLTSGAGTSSSSHTTASIKPHANRLVLVGVLTGGSTNTQTSLSGCGLSWNRIVRNPWSGTNIFNVFRALSDAPTEGQITITHDVVGAGAAWWIFEIETVDPTGSSGANAIVQAVENSGTGTTASATLAAFAASVNATVGIFASTDNLSFNAGTGYNNLGNQAESGQLMDLAAEWRPDNDTSVDMTISSTNWYAWAAEIKTLASLSDTPAVGGATLTGAQGSLIPGTVMKPKTALREAA